MKEYIIMAIVWTLALYGLFEIIKQVISIYTYTKLKAEGIYLIVAVKNQENKIEGFLRSLFFKYIYHNDEYIKNIVITDLDSTDQTKEIIYKMQNDYEYIKVNNWKECRELLDSIDNSKSDKEKEIIEQKEE